MASRALVCLGLTSVLHYISLGIPRALLSRAPQTLAYALGLGSAELLPASFQPTDILDGGLAVATATAHLMLIQRACPARATRAGSTAFLRHAALAMLLVLGEGIHISANPLEEHMENTLLLELDRGGGGGGTATRRMHAAVLWQHEVLAHCVFAAASMLLILHASLVAEPSDEEGDGEGRVGALATAFLHGMAMSFFFIGTRTAGVAFPLALLLLLAWAVRRSRVGAPLVTGYGGVVGGCIVGVHGGWLLSHDWTMPTFDDLSPSSSSLFRYTTNRLRLTGESFLRWPPALLWVGPAALCSAALMAACAVRRVAAHSQQQQRRRPNKWKAM